jgi:hypothetical protein
MLGVAPYGATPAHLDQPEWLAESYSGRHPLRGPTQTEL